MKIEAEFVYEKETRNFFRFQEIGAMRHIGTLYVQKATFEKQPKRLRVTVEVIE